MKSAEKQTIQIMKNKAVLADGCETWHLSSDGRIKVFTPGQFKKYSELKNLKLLKAMSNTTNRAKIQMRLIITAAVIIYIALVVLTGGNKIYPY